MSAQRRLSRTKAAVAATLAAVLVAAIPPSSAAPATQRAPRIRIPEIPSFKMGAVPPYMLAHMAKSASLTDAERESARKTLEPSNQFIEDRLALSLAARVPVRVLERLADDQSIACSDEARRELMAILSSSRSRWPHMPEVPVSNELERVLKENPGLWESGKTAKEKKTEKRTEDVKEERNK